jgi:hypothetical protein
MIPAAPLFAVVRRRPYASGVAPGHSAPRPFPTARDRTVTPPPADEPVRIIGVIAEEVGVPMTYGMATSGFYRVPLRLSRTVSLEWENLFERLWNHSQKFSTLRRASIAKVDSDRIILSCTTLEEVVGDHKPMLVECVRETNLAFEQKEVERKAREAEFAQARAEHRKRVDDLKGKLRFE